MAAAFLVLVPSRGGLVESYGRRARESAADAACSCVGVKLAEPTDDACMEV